MFIGGGFGVGLTVTDLVLAADLPAVSRPRLSEVLPVATRTAAEKALELQRVQQLKSVLAAYEMDLVAGLAADRPATTDRRPGEPGAAGSGAVPGPGTPEGVSEFFADELALVLNTSRAAATALTDQADTLTRKLPATWGALADGRLDWPRARAIAHELGWKARDTDPQVIAAVEAAVLPGAAGLSVRQLTAAVIRELAARDAAASDRRRRDAARAANVTVRPLRDGMSELVALLPSEAAAACRATLDGHAKAARAAGDTRPLGLLRAGALLDLLLRPWTESHTPVTAQLTVIAPLDALRPAPPGSVGAFLDGGAPCPPAFTGGNGATGATGGDGPAPGSVPAPTGEVDGQPITAAHLRALLTQLDSLCPGGLQAPAGGTLRLALTDPDGTLRAVLDRRQLAGLVRRGCPTHPATPDCACPLLDRPPPVDRYRPTPAQRRWVTTRDRTCRHPGCSNKAGWADLDHVIPHACGGETACQNLCCLCRRHHRLKTHARGWTYTMTPDGVLTVSTPTGVTRTSRPPGRRPADRPSAGRRPADSRPSGTGPPGTSAPDRPPGLTLTGPRVIATRPEQPPPPLDPVDDPPPF